MRALILVDLQNDFLPNGALAVPRGDEVIAVANQLQPAFDVVVATQDWHPEDHGSFASNNEGKKPYDLHELGGLPQVMWPDHCVQGTKGAAFHEALDTSRISRVFPKGTDARIDSYSGFFDNDKKKSTGLGEWLKARGVTDVTLVGLATDYCVKASALDAVALGFETTVVEDAVRGVNISPDDHDNALEELRQAGVRVVDSSAVLAEAAKRV